jgi:Uma2 family endonuclease
MNVPLPQSATELPPVTPEDLLQMPDGHHYELVNGKLVERNMGAESSGIAANFIRLVGQFVHAHNLGKVFVSDCGYQCFADDPKKVRYADGSFIARGRLPDDRTPKGHVRIAPDFAVEVVSPNDLADEVEAKRVEWLRAGVRLLWIVYPQTQTVHVYRLSAHPLALGGDDELKGDDVLPNFTCKAAELFEGL